MKKLLLLTGFLAFSMLLHAGVDRYFIGEIEISRDDYLALDSALLRGSGVWTDADTARYVAEPSIYARIDTTSWPGHVRLVRKSPAETAVIDSILNAYRTESAMLKTGDTVSDFTFNYYLSASREPLSYARQLKGKVVLLNFWATWCGPCVEELKTEHLPALLAEFEDCDNFVFLPVSVNHSHDELAEFFQSPVGQSLRWLEAATAWDRNGEFADALSAGGIPLTILIDANGTVRLNEAGAFLTAADADRLRTALRTLLH